MDEQLKPFAGHYTDQAVNLYLREMQPHLALFYQPIVGMLNYEVASIEILLRWDHPTQGLLLPEQFLPIAETNNTINDLTYWTIEACFKQLKTWVYAHRHLAMNINISEFALHDKNFLSHLTDLQSIYGIPPHLLHLEISEQALVNLGEHAGAFLQKLLPHVGQIIIDDFNLKYINLYDVVKLPFHSIKLSRSLTDKLGKDPLAPYLTKCLIDSAHNLKKQVYSVGIETADNWKFLTENGCDVGQGHFICKPLPMHEINHWLGICN